MPSEEKPVSNLAHPSWTNPWVVLASVLIVAIVLIGVVRIHTTTAVRTAFKRTGAGFQVAPGMARRFGAAPVVYGPQVDGVVTTVNGNTLTVAGNGTTTSVDVGGSTTYSGATSALVNDTVVATGTFSGNVLDATAISVNPQ